MDNCNKWPSVTLIILTLANNTWDVGYVWYVISNHIHTHSIRFCNAKMNSNYIPLVSSDQPDISDQYLRSAHLCGPGSRVTQAARGRGLAEEFTRTKISLNWTVRPHASYITTGKTPFSRWTSTELNCSPIVTFFLFTYFNFLSQKKICLGKEVFYPTKRFFLNSENIVHQQRTGKTSMIRTEWKFGSKSPLQRKHKDRKMGLKSTWLRLVVWSNPHCISDCIKTSIKTRPLDRKFAI